MVSDPDERTLEGWLRAGERLEAVPEMDGFVSPRVGIRFEPGEGADNLTIVGPGGEPFRTHLEDLDRGKAAEHRAEAERRNAEAERQRAQHAEERAARYAARLRELGIEPD